MDFLYSLFGVAENTNIVGVSLKEGYYEMSFHKQLESDIPSEQKRTAVYECLKTTNVIELPGMFAFLFYNSPKINSTNLNLEKINQCLASNIERVTSGEFSSIQSWLQSVQQQQQQQQPTKGGYRKKRGRSSRRCSNRRKHKI